MFNHAESGRRVIIGFVSMVMSNSIRLVINGACLGWSSSDDSSHPQIHRERLKVPGSLFAAVLPKNLQLQDRAVEPAETIDKSVHGPFRSNRTGESQNCSG